MSVVNNFNDARERGLIELIQTLEDNKESSLTESEKKLIASIYEFAFNHGVHSGVTLLTDGISETIGKDDHES